MLKGRRPLAIRRRRIASHRATVRTGNSRWRSMLPDRLVRLPELLLL